MQHIILLEEILALILGFASLSLLLFSYASVKRKDVLLLSIAVIFQNARIVMFALTQYNKLSSLKLFPRDVARTELRWFLYYLFLAFVSYFLLAWLFSLGRWKGFRLVSVVYWVYYGVALGLKSLIALGLDDLPFLHTGFYYAGVALGSVVADKVAIALACAAFLLRKKDASGERHPLLRWAVASLALAQGMDILTTFIPPHPVPIFFGFLFFYGFPFMVAIDLRKRPAFTDEAESLELGLAEFVKSRALNPADTRIIAGILTGKGNKEIAYGEGLSLSTLKHRVFLLYRQLGISSRFELIALYRKTKP